MTCLLTVMFSDPRRWQGEREQIHWRERTSENTIKHAWKSKPQSSYWGRKFYQKILKLSYSFSQKYIWQVVLAGSASHKRSGHGRSWQYLHNTEVRFVVSNVGFQYRANGFDPPGTQPVGSSGAQWMWSKHILHAEWRSSFEMPIDIFFCWVFLTLSGVGGSDGILWQTDWTWVDCLLDWRWLNFPPERRWVDFHPEWRWVVTLPAWHQCIRWWQHDTTQSLHCRQSSSVSQRDWRTDQLLLETQSSPHDIYTVYKT